ncbi:sensor histidine kinase [Alkaliphilus hydrothermalis]|uniref:histidine kinase n=1 Tax=Alkaliphilus hydrothermalis TaxID=1482730 RepID=A0ABS2NTT1_9FIRM|nr:sensor histidine kinase [Alkaliphilus hydrothermalis]MBM7616357.1 NarL family two-component system sensor histidine kinase LiaS [Alkaliphilus hydrothermalis]
MFSRYLKNSFFSNSLQWVIIEKILIASLGSCIITSLALWSLFFRPEGSFLLNAPPKWRISIVFGIILFTCVFTAFLFSLPFGRGLKEELLKVEEAHEAVSRGRINLRLPQESYREINQINHQFNCMAEYTEKQVESLQRLVNENKLLVKNAEETASIDERKKIARELHDAVSQQLFATSITLGAIKNLLTQNPTEAIKYFEKVEVMVHTAQQELRALIMHLRPVSLKGFSLTVGLDKFLKELDDKNKNVNIRWEIEDVANLSEGVEDNLFRVIQEGVSNVLRHSKATTLMIRLYVRNRVLSIIIEDNGVGFDSKKDNLSSYGIDSMKERVADVGGRLDLLSYPNKGTRVEIRVPI